MNNRKIISISMIKNEMDIIESFVRYNINIFDEMIILDNGSTDSTLKILKNLKKEGLNLFIIEDVDREFSQTIKMNQLLSKAVNEFNADIIVPLDADEFLISSNKINPRKLLEKINLNNCYQVKWKTYVPVFGKNQNSEFIPSKITYSRDNALEEFYKVIITKELVKNFNVELTKGNHNITHESNQENPIKCIDIHEMRIAHFPIRSKEHAMSKIVLGWIYSLSDPNRTENQSWHRKKMFNYLKDKGKIENEDVTNLAKYYALKDEQVEIKINDDPIYLDFCKDIKVRYSNEKIKPIRDLLENYEMLSLSYLNLKKEKISTEAQFKAKLEDLLTEMHNQQSEWLEEEKLLKKKIGEYENSTSWTITSPLRKISNKLKK